MSFWRCLKFRHFSENNDIFQINSLACSDRSLVWLFSPGASVSTSWSTSRWNVRKLYQIQPYAWRKTSIVLPLICMLQRIRTGKWGARQSVPRSLKIIFGESRAGSLCTFWWNVASLIKSVISRVYHRVQNALSELKNRCAVNLLFFTGTSTVTWTFEVCIALWQPTAQTKRRGKQECNWRKNRQQSKNDASAIKTTNFKLVLRYVPPNYWQGNSKRFGTRFDTNNSDLCMLFHHIICCCQISILTCVSGKDRVKPRNYNKQDFRTDINFKSICLPLVPAKSRSI